MEILSDGAAFGAEQGKAAFLIPHAGHRPGHQCVRNMFLALGLRLHEESQAWHLCGQTAACWHWHSAWGLADKPFTSSSSELVRWGRWYPGLHLLCPNIPADAMQIHSLSTSHHPGWWKVLTAWFTCPICFFNSHLRQDFLLLWWWISLNGPNDRIPLPCSRSRMHTQWTSESIFSQTVLDQGLLQQVIYLGSYLSSALCSLLSLPLDVHRRVHHPFLGICSLYLWTSDGNVPGSKNRCMGSRQPDFLLTWALCFSCRKL